MIELLALIGSAIDPLLNWFSDNRGSHNEQKQDASNALYLALEKTRDYLHNQDGSASDFRRLWFEASNKLRVVDPKLADDCFRKMEYWTAIHDNSNQNKPDADFLKNYSLRFDDMWKKFRKIQLIDKP